MVGRVSPSGSARKIPLRSRPIQGVGTAVAGFIGFSESGPFHQPTPVTDWSRFVELFGGFTGAGYLASAVHGYFANGGGSAYVVRVGEAPPSPSPLSAGDYIGGFLDRKGLAALEAEASVTMIAVPDLMSGLRSGAIGLDSVQAVQQEMIRHCESMGDRLAILDPPPGLGPQQMGEWRQAGAGYDSGYAALYYPWFTVLDPSTGTARAVPPSGHIAGVWSGTGTGGVHEAPANRVIEGALELETRLAPAEAELLDSMGVNSIREFPGHSIRVWGARTLSSDANWRHLAVRRLVSYLEESIVTGTRWVVLEPDDERLWAAVRRSISAFLIDEWRTGALAGSTPDAAFFVRCDGQTNTAEGIAAGQVVCQVGVAPLRPGEFVHFRVTQFAGGTGLVTE
jgi:phage tail sheath protein FI